MRFRLSIVEKAVNNPPVCTFGQTERTKTKRLAGGTRELAAWLLETTNSIRMRA